MRYLITGITGFAGAHLAQLLYNEGHEICALVRRSNGTGWEAVIPIETTLKDLLDYWMKKINH